MRALDRSVLAGAAADPGKVFLFDTFEGVTRNVGEKNMISLAVCPAPGEESAVEAILVMFRLPTSTAWPPAGATTRGRRW